MSEKFGLDSELHLRLADFGGQKQQILIRPSIYYKLNQNVSFYTGYTYISTFPYGDQPIAARTPENNVWVQAHVKQNIGKVGISHRYRLEERWTGNITANGNAYELNGTTHRNRIRYRLTAKYVLPKDPRFYLTVFDEVWVNYGKNVGLNYLDQNWLYAGAGFLINKETALEIAYQWQIIEKSDGYHKESNNTLQLSLHYNLPNKKS